MNELDAAIKRAAYGRTFPKFSTVPARLAVEADPPEPPQMRPPKVIEIKRAVADYFSVSLVDIDSARRDPCIARPRHIAMYLCRVMTTHSYPEIGRRMGDRDHTTVMHAIDKIENLLVGANKDTSLKLGTQIEEIKANVLAKVQNGKA